MNRRTFFQRTVGAIAAAVIAPTVRWMSPIVPVEHSALTFKGVPLMFSQYKLSNTIYFLNKDGPYRLNGTLPEKLWSDVDG